MMPFWYGPSYLEHTLMSWVCYPIPLNFLLRYARGLWFWLMRTPRSDLVGSSYRQGIKWGKDSEARFITRRLNSEIRDLNLIRAWILQLKQKADAGNDLAKDMLKTPVFQMLGVQSQMQWPLTEYLMQWAAETNPDDLLCWKCGQSGHSTKKCLYIDPMVNPETLGEPV